MNESARSTGVHAARRPIQVSLADVTIDETAAEGRGPVILSPVSHDAVDLVSWATANQASIDQHLAARGGMLFRGFDIAGLAGFDRIARTLCGELMEYTYRSTPRTKLSDGIYTSTEYPPDQKIPQHNENAYATSWPLRIAFGCLEPAATGGETPTAYSPRIFDRIPPSIRDRFIAAGVMYVRNYHKSLDLPWQEVFQTGSPTEVEKICAGLNISVQWKSDGGLRTTQICQAAAKHPTTGELVWFNQAHLFHIAAQPQYLREVLIENFGIENLPRNALYGDGTPIDDGVIDQIRRTYEQEEVIIPWRRGDILLLDNMLRSHGRLPFKGSRRVLVGMGGITNGADLTLSEGIG